MGKVFSTSHRGWSVVGELTPGGQKWTAAAFRNPRRLLEATTASALMSLIDMELAEADILKAEWEAALAKVES